MLQESVTMDRAGEGGMDDGGEIKNGLGTLP